MATYRQVVSRAAKLSQESLNRRDTLLFAESFRILDCDTGVHGELIEMRPDS